MKTNTHTSGSNGSRWRGRTRRCRPARCAAGALALAVGASAPMVARGQQEALSFSDLSDVRFFLNWQDWFNLGITGKDVVVANLDIGHPIDHEAYKGKVKLRIAWPFRGTGSGPLSVVDRNFSAMHPTATVGAIISDSVVGRLNAVGIAPDATAISASLASGLDPASGTVAEDEITAWAFGLLAVSDQDFANSLADALGVDRWKTATVINVPVTSAGGQDGSTPDDQAVNMIANQFGVTIVAPAGDLGDADFFDDPMAPPGTIGQPGSAHNVITVGRSTVDFTDVPESSGKGPLPFVDWESVLDNMADNGMDCPPRGGGGGQGGGEGGAAMGVGRPGAHLVAPGTNITLPGSPIVPATAPGAVETFFSFWEGTSFSTSLVAGAAALVHDAGRRYGLPINDLVTKAVILNSVNKTTVQPSIQGQPIMDADLGEDNAILFSTPFDPDLGLGQLDLRRLRDQYIGPIIDPFNTGYADITPASGIITSGEVMIGDDLVPPTPPGGGLDGEAGTEVRDHVPCIPFVDCGTFALKPVDIDMLFETGRLPSRDCPLAGKTRFNCETGFVSRFLPPGASTGGGLGAAPTPNDSDSAPVQQPLLASAPRDDAAAQDGRPVAQDQGATTEIPESLLRPLELWSAQSDPGLFGDDPPLCCREEPRLGSGSANRVGSAQGVTVQTTRAASLGARPRSVGGAVNEFIRTGWDYGTIGQGEIDIPIGFVPAGATITATLVWDHEVKWDLPTIEQELIKALTAPQPLAQTFRPPRLIANKPSLIDPLTGTPQANPSNEQVVLQLNTTATGQGDQQTTLSILKRYRYENLDLELWRASAGGGGAGNQLIARSNSTWSNMEHIAVSGSGATQGGGMQTDLVTTGFYFLRIKWGGDMASAGGGTIRTGTLYDLGGYFFSDVQDTMVCQAFRVPGLENPFPANTDYAVAWFVEAQGLTPNASFGLPPQNGIFSASAPSAPGDVNNDGFVNSADLNMVLGSMGSTNPSMDFNGDGVVSAADVNIVLQNFGSADSAGGVKKLAKAQQKIDKINRRISDVSAEIDFVQRQLAPLLRRSDAGQGASLHKQIDRMRKRIAKLERTRDKLLLQRAKAETTLSRRMRAPTIPTDLSQPPSASPFAAGF